MSPLEKRALGFILLGAITVLGFYWQYKLFSKDKKQFKDAKYYNINKAPARIKFGFWLCTLMIAGIIVHGLIAIHIDRQPYTYAQIWAEVLTTLLFSLIFLVKSFFGPVLTMGGVAIAAYYYLNYGIATNLPIVTTLMNFAASLAPDWLKNIYAIVYSGYAITTSLYDTTVDV